MNKNNLKQSIALAFGITAIGLQGTSFALGLSEIEVQSSLGEPLKASVNVLGANELKDPSCIRLGPNSDLGNVSFKLSALRGTTANLSISSRQLVNEPIVNLSVIAGCESTVARDYVLLLDPPLSNFANNIESPVIVQKVDTNNINSTIQVPVQATPQQTKAPTKPKTKRVRKKKVAAKKSKKTAVVQPKSNMVERVYDEKASQVTSEDNKPRLSISGGTSRYVGNTQLRMERHLRFMPNPNAPAIVDVEIDDEITVMNNRLKHLQQQITKLQSQNDELVSDNKLKSKQLADSKKPGFIAPLLGALAFLGLGAIAFLWLRRRQATKIDHSNENIWGNTQKEKINVSEPKLVTPKQTTKEQASKKQERIEDEATELFADLNADINSPIEQKESPEGSMESIFAATSMDEPDIILKEEEFSVLDHADVFLSHGRATLAIQLLQNHLLEHPKQSVTIWLFLLDLLQKEKLQTVYQETALDCKLHFNVEVADFSETAEPVALSDKNSLEDFPHLTKGLQKVWGTSASVIYLDDLIYNNRLEPRAGLPKTVFEELVLLRSMAQEKVNSADVIQLEEKKVAINEEKEAMLEAKKTEKLKAIADAEIEAKKASDNNETDFEFTLVD